MNAGLLRQQGDELIFRDEDARFFVNGGLRTRGMVGDYRGQLSSSESDRQRAAEAGIAIVSGAQLKDLKGAISRLWLARGE